VLYDTGLVDNWQFPWSGPGARGGGSCGWRQARGHRARSHTTAGLVERYDDQVHPFALDVTGPQAAGDAIAAAVEAFARLDVLVNNAGSGDIGSIEDTSLADIRAQIETNLFGVINVTKAAIPLMREQRSAHIIQF
jgi:NAD(P)-dependent dehydrogenase (short-subunit alcohol dehydrogenase family)